MAAVGEAALEAKQIIWGGLDKQFANMASTLS